MKRLFVLAIVAVSLAACGSSKPHHLSWSETQTLITRWRFSHGLYDYTCESVTLLVVRCNPPNGGTVNGPFDFNIDALGYPHLAKPL